MSIYTLVLRTQPKRIFIEDYFREIYGRRFPVVDNLPLTFPADNAELLRSDLEHASIKLLMGGNQWGPIAETLTPVRGRRRRVLDICTRSGIWCVPTTWSLALPGV